MFRKLLKSVGLYRGEVTKTNDKGKTYTGPYIYNLGNENGRLITDKYEYTGEIHRLNDDYDMYGNGICTFNTGTVYQGEFYMGKPNGQLKIIKNNNIIMEGIVEMGQLKSGYYLTESGDRIQSEKFLLKNLCGGDVTVERISGDRFVGTVYDSSLLYFQKETELIMPDVSYSNGVLTKNNGDIYQGKWYFQFFDGEITHISGDVYTGKTFNDDYTAGKLETKDGYVFEGEWVNKTFVGKVKYPNGDEYTGVCKNDKRNGEGMLSLASGDVYCCNWTNDLKNGKGYQIVDGIRTTKHWNNDLEIEVEQPLNIKCPECRENLSFMLSKCKILEKYMKEDNICEICTENVCNINLPCQHQYCSECIKLIQ